MDQPRRLCAAILAFTAVIAIAGAAWAQAQPAAPKLSITDETLPPLNVGIDVRFPLHATGGVPPYHWLLAAGELPPGIVLDPAGFLFGRPQKPGPYGFTLTVTDSARPANTINKEFNTRVKPALLLEWLRPPEVHDNRIDGVAQVSNGTEQDDFDLTVIIVAVNDVGRATALGYQHMTLKPGVTDFEIKFGSTMPPGTYIVHADAIAEILPKGIILRQHLQTAALSVVQGP